MLGDIVAEVGDIVYVTLTGEWQKGAGAIGSNMTYPIEVYLLAKISRISRSFSRARTYDPAEDPALLREIERFNAIRKMLFS